MKKSTSLQYFSTTPTCSIQLDKNGNNISGVNSQDTADTSPRSGGHYMSPAKLESMRAQAASADRGAPQQPPHVPPTAQGPSMATSESHEDVFQFE